jgi:hypothetical protein
MFYRVCCVCVIAASHVDKRECETVHGGRKYDLISVLVNALSTSVSVQVVVLK